MSQLQENSAPDRNYRTPGWVKVFGSIVLILILLFVILQVISGGNHGPGRHLPANNPSLTTATAEDSAPHGG